MATEHDAALDVADAYFASWAEGDMHRLRDLLDENVSIVLPNSGDTIIPSTRFDGSDEALGYLRFAYETFERLTFRDEQWVVSQDAGFVYLHATGDMIARPNGKHYENVYVFRLHLQGDKIVEVLEYTNPIIWSNLGLN